jgi:cell division protein FtsW
MRATAATGGRGHQPDYVLAIVTFVLLAFGLVMIYSISPVLSYKLLGTTSKNVYFFGQVINLIVGVLFWVLSSKLYHQHWRRMAPWLLVLAGIALVALLIPELSFSKNGATRWLRLGPVSFQPAELLKLALIVYMATWFEKKGDDLRDWWGAVVPFSLILFAASFVVVVLQRDLGTMLVLALAMIAMYFVAGIRWRHLAAILGGAGVLGVLAIVTFPHRLSRWMTFLDPAKDPTGQGYHITQALTAVGTGGLFGVGLGKSIFIHGYLPEAANDSIFAVVAEEFGLIGSVILIGLFGLLVYRGFRIAKGAPDHFSRLLATGVATWLMFQAIINIAAMLALVPLTGIPLPFISYGGSSLLFSLIGVGILLNISKYTTIEVTNAHSSDRRRYGWSHYTGTGNGRRVKTAR